MKKKLIISYDGTNYCGWQIQPNGISIQQVIEEKLFNLYGKQARIPIEGSGRTDAGVHAIGQSAHYTEPEKPKLENEKIFKALNRLLPSDIRIISVSDVPDSFHARFSAKAKTYCYVINNGIENAFTARYSWNLRTFTNICEVRKALDFIKGKHDFSSFTVERSQIEDPVRTILKCEVRESKNYICILVTADGFLYKMVRSIVGTLAFVGMGRISAEDFFNIFNAKDRTKAFDTAPPQGLFLVKVFYDENEILSFGPPSFPFYLL